MLRKLVKYFMLIISIFVAAIFALCRFVPAVNPYDESIFALLGLATPILALINAGFAIFWLISRKYYFILIPLLAFVLSWRVYSVAYGGKINQVQDFKHDSNRFSVMSYNVRLLDLYNWSGKKETRRNILSYIKQKNPTVLCLQEFYTGNDSIGINNIKAIQDSCDYAYFADCNVNVNKRGKWGNIIFSHEPILSNINHDVDVIGNNMLQETTLKLHDDTITLFNIHLKSNKFSKDETILMSSGELPEFDDKVLHDSKSIYKKLTYSTINRGLEADLVGNIIEQKRNPTVVCGDLNDMPSSYVYFKMRNNLSDAFLTKGFGLGATYLGNVPFLRIDYIFFSNQLQLRGFVQDDIRYSDHKPLLANFELL